jgi:hypothetical protein
MANYAPSTRARIADLITGMRVDKASIAIAAISTKSLFTVVGGNCLVVGLIGEVTTIIETKANNTKYISTPTTGTATDMCAVVDITAQEAGGLLNITGVLADAAIKGTAGAAAMMANGIVVAPGTIGLNTAADSTGNMKFSIWYVPLEDGAYIEAA